MLAQGDIESVLEDRIIFALSSALASRALARIGASKIVDTSSFAHTPFKDNGYGVVVQLGSGEEFVITISRMEER
jgi:hypothetical protein